MTVYERVKQMGIEELADFLTACLDVPTRRSYVPFDDVVEEVSRSFGIPKREAWQRYHDRYGGEGKIDGFMWKDWQQPCELFQIKAAGYCGWPELGCDESCARWLESEEEEG